MEGIRRTILVKLGGSAITEKNSFETLKEEVVLETGRQVHRVRKCSEEMIDIVLIHGAGSFGHFQAHEYGISHGGIVDENGVKHWKKGFVLTRDSVTSLNRIVVRILTQECHLPVVGISPFPNAICCGNKYLHPDHTDPLSSLSNLVSLGLIPVIHGDAVLDTTQDCTIFGGDHIIRWLCTNEKSQLFPSRVVFLTDVAGIYTCSPDEMSPDNIPKLISNIFVDNMGDIHYDDDADETLKKVSPHGLPNIEIRSHDVTGGLKEKLSCVSEIVHHAKGCLEVYIVQAGTEHAEAALSGLQPQVATRVSYRFP